MTFKILAGEKLEVWGLLWEVSKVYQSSMLKKQDDTYLPIGTSLDNLQFFYLTKYLH